MAYHRRLVSVPAHDRARRPATRSAAAVPGRDPGDSRFRCSLARFTRKISIAEHLLAAVGPVGWRRPLRAGVGATARSVGSIPANQLDRGHWRRDVFARKKRGDDVGKTKKGKGTKIMLLIDSKGTPLAADIASASEAEVNLIEPLLDRSVGQYLPDRL